MYTIQLLSTNTFLMIFVSSTHFHIVIFIFSFSFTFFFQKKNYQSLIIFLLFFLYLSLYQSSSILYSPWNLFFCFFLTLFSCGFILNIFQSVHHHISSFYLLSFYLCFLLLLLPLFLTFPFCTNLKYCTFFFFFLNSNCHSTCLPLFTANFHPAGLLWWAKHDNNHRTCI